MQRTHICSFKHLSVMSQTDAAPNTCCWFFFFYPMSQSFLLEIWNCLAERSREGETDQAFGHECGIKPEYTHTSAACGFPNPCYSCVILRLQKYTLLLTNILKVIFLHLKPVICSDYFTGSAHHCWEMDKLQDSKTQTWLLHYWGINPWSSF